MLFNKKPRCYNCNSKLNGKFSYCPYCGEPFLDHEKEARDSGLLGKKDNQDILANQPQPQFSFGITDKFLGTIMNNLIKTLDKQFKHLDKESRESNRSEKAEIQGFPNGIKIRIGPIQQGKMKNEKNFFKKSLTQQQSEKMSSLPRTEAKSKIKRIGEKIIYEINAPGIQSPEDIFISKLESGYEIKAISDKKVYVNTLPVNLPIKGFAINDNKLFIEFHSHNHF